MVSADQLADALVFAAVFLGTILLGRWLLDRLFGDQRRAAARMRRLSPDGGDPPEKPKAGVARSVLPWIGTLVMPGDREHLARLKARLTQAGIYGPNAVIILLGAQALLTALLPATTALLPFVLGLLAWQFALILALVAAGVGLLTPSLWVDYQRNRRRNELLRSLPDAIDMLVLCVEAGLSLTAALQRATAELQVVHPALAQEMNIVQREMQLGLSAGDALKKFADRGDVPGVRELAAVVQQAERYGTSSVKALRLHAESCRQERQQRAEEKAQKAAVKIVFPTLLCIFPAIFIVLVGPAAFQIADLLSKMK